MIWVRKKIPPSGKENTIYINNQDAAYHQPYGAAWRIIRQMKRYLVLENGTVFEGEAFGADHDVIAEIVFNTAMTGYVETLSDQRYIGQAVCQTFPLIGNYGVNESDADGEPVSVSAYIVREYSDIASNFRSEGELDEYLKKNNVPGLCGIDTRALTKILREQGTMNGMITDDPDKADMTSIKNYRITNAVEKASSKAVSMEKGGNGPKIALYDMGRKNDIVRTLVNHGCEVYVFPYDTPAEDILAVHPDGIVISNGPGNPADCEAVVYHISVLLKNKIPMMGIGLGHQLLALANGFSTTKLKYGHRGCNHPTKSTENGKLYITAQNHGYAVVGETIDQNIAEELFYNINDMTNEGLLYKNIPAISVQFSPEASGGPNDTDFIYERFLAMIKEPLI